MMGEHSSSPIKPQASPKRQIRLHEMFSIVVLDPNGPIRELLSEWLTGADHRVWDARQLSAAAAAEIDVVLIDLPKLRDGAQALVARARETYPRAALLGLSTQLSASLPAGSPTVRELGLHALLTKPCVPSELFDALASLPVPHRA